MKNILIFNTQAFGDALCGTHLAKVIRKDIKNCNITFAIRDDFTLTMSTNEPDSGRKDILDILMLQEGIDNTVLIDPKKGRMVLYSGEKVTKFDKIYMQNEWWSDLGLCASQQISYYLELNKEINREAFDTETKYNVGTPKKLPSHYRVATSGPLDFNNKLKNEQKRLDIIKGIEDILPGVEIITLGSEMGRKTYLESAQLLNNCHLFVGPNGSLIHLSAGLDVDTITINATFPAYVSMPSGYHSGFHKDVMARPEHHCGTFKCITNKLYNSKEPPAWGSPKSEFTTWPQSCHYMASGQSCISNFEVQDVLALVKEWKKVKMTKEFKVTGSAFQGFTNFENLTLDTVVNKLSIPSTFKAPIFFNHSQIDKIKKAKKVFDIGCGIGRNMQEIMLQTKANYYGVDPNKDVIKFFWDFEDNIKYKDRAYISSSFDEEITKHKYDLIICTFVFQHIGYHINKQPGAMDVDDITQQILPLTTPETIWFVVEHDSEEPGWRNQWLATNKFIVLEQFLDREIYTFDQQHRILLLKNENIL